MKTFVVLFLVLQSTLFQATTVMAELNSVRKDELAGIIIDRTQSVIARDFSQHFAKIWTNEYSNLDYSVTINESVSPRSGNLITIYYQQNVVYEAALNRRGDNRETGMFAARYVVQRIQMLASTSNTDFDLAQDEI